MAPEAGSRALAWSFVGPALLLLLAFNIFPLAWNIVLSFTNADLTGGSWEWVGGRNYATLFSDKSFAAKYGDALRTTGLFTVAAVAGELILGFALALTLRRDFRGKTALLAVLLLPMMLSPAVMGLFWNLIFEGTYGPLNQVLGLAGLDQPAWRTEHKMLCLLLVDVWMWTPFMMLISLAGLNAIPTSLYEAAEIDRTPAWRVFTRITLPLCAPLLGLAVLLRATDALKQFDLVMAITGPNDQATQTVSALLYQITFANQKVGLGAAYAIVVLVVVIAVATLFTRYLDWMAAKQGREA
jgi:multiple sugar transport system permease protein